MCTSFDRVLAALLVTIAVSSPGILKAQAPNGRVPQEAAGLGQYGEALLTLNQVRGPQPRKKLDAIADSLTAIAITTTGSDARSAETRLRVIGILTKAGQGGTGIPYPGAAERLLRIAQAGRGAALVALTQLPDRPEAIQLMRQAARSNTPLATAAVGHLVRDMGPEGVAAARELHVRNLVTEEYARSLLATLARQHGWPTPQPRHRGDLSEEAARLR